MLIFCLNRVITRSVIPILRALKATLLKNFLVIADAFFVLICFDLLLLFTGLFPCKLESRVFEASANQTRL